MSQTHSGGDKIVRQFRQILLWPLQLMPIRPGSQIQEHWEVLERACEPGEENPWHEVADVFGDPAQFQERHYNELVTFLPYVQRFLYGEGRSTRAIGAQGGEHGASPVRVFRRRDIAAVRLLARPGAAPLTLSIARIDLYFLLRHRRRAAQCRGVRPRPAPRAGAGHAVSPRARVSRRLGRRRAAAARHGARRLARCRGA